MAVISGSVRRGVRASSTPSVRDEERNEVEEEEEEEGQQQQRHADEVEDHMAVNTGKDTLVIRGDGCCFVFARL